MTREATIDFDPSIVTPDALVAAVRAPVMGRNCRPLPMRLSFPTMAEMTNTAACGSGPS